MSSAIRRSWQHADVLTFYKLPMASRFRITVAMLLNQNQKTNIAVHPASFGEVADTIFLIADKMTPVLRRDAVILVSLNTQHTGINHGCRYFERVNRRHNYNL